MSTARSLNKVLIIGNLTRNPVLKSTSGGATVCTFGVATNATWRDSNNNTQERTEFHNIVCWNKLGEICAQLLSTGMLVYLEGELRTRTWDDDNGVRHYKTEIKIDEMKLLDDKDKKGVGVNEATVESNTVKTVSDDNNDDSDDTNTADDVVEDNEEKSEDNTDSEDSGEDLF